MRSVRNMNWGEIIYMTASLVSSIYLMKWAITQLDPNKHHLEQAKKRQKELAEQLGRPLIKLQGLEAAIAAEVVNPDAIGVQLSDIGGLDNIVKALMNHIILPLRRPELFGSHLLHQPKGVLLYGPPGTGKTMLAKALAKESGAVFLNISASSLQSKWYGETHKLVAAIFSLAAKLQPAIVFIDEVDGLLGRRREQDHEATTSMKTEFMSHWDGLLSERQTNVLVLGATNRPSELDEAVLRRFNLKYPVSLPDEAQREAILRVTLQRHAQDNALDESLLRNEPLPSGERPLQVLARQTEGYSGSDLFELCAQAAVIPVHEFVEAMEDGRSSAGSDRNGGAAASPALDRPRPMAFRDLQAALEAEQPVREASTSQDEGLQGPPEWAHMLAYFLAQAQKQQSPQPPQTAGQP